MRSRDDPEELARARAAVAAWRDQNPAGTAGQLVAALGGGYHPIRAVARDAVRDRPGPGYRKVGREASWTGESEPSPAACLD